MKPNFRFLAFLLAIFLAPLLQAQNDFGYEDDLASLYGDEDFISIATGRKQLISEAPSVASVITSDDLKAAGASTLEEALEMVPGVHVSRRAAGYSPIFTIRGIHSEFNPQVLVLINGIPITNQLFGNRGLASGSMPIHTISRIEVIRGPGSAIYGADAFAGTINIITKTPDEMKNIAGGISYGSFASKGFWLEKSTILNDWALGFGIDFSETNGYEEIITSDLQSQIDSLYTGFFPPASLAPGQVNVGRQNLEFHAEANSDYWTLRVGGQKRSNVGTGAGGNGSLDPDGEGNLSRITADVTYETNDFADDWELKTTLSFQDFNEKLKLILFPENAFGGSFPEGVIGKPEYNERHLRFDFSTFYTGIEKHDIRLGLGFYYQDLYNVSEDKNYVTVITGNVPVPVPLGEIISQPFNQEKIRRISYAFVQDEWKLATDWSLTAGLRFDDYSDFGNTLNPRLALVWQTSLNLTTKLLYGRAFRAPSFAEQFNINNPVAIGNENLDPEIINTYELAFDYSPTPEFRTGLNIFYYKMKDIIRFTPIAQNTGNQSGHGLEWEFDWDLTEKLKLIGNYALQKSTDNDTNSDAPNAPENQVYLRLDYELAPQWSLNSQVNHVMDRKRYALDTRPEIDDYTTADFTLRGHNLRWGVDLSVSVKNLFDEAAYEPSLYREGGAYIPNDLPLAGRSFFAEISKNW